MIISDSGRDRECQCGLGASETLTATVTQPQAGRRGATGPGGPRASPGRGSDSAQPQWSCR